MEQFRFWGYFALRDSSLVVIREEEERTAKRLAMLNALGDLRDVVIVWQDDDVTWRKITYYFPGHPSG